MYDEYVIKSLDFVFIVVFQFRYALIRSQQINKKIEYTERFVQGICTAYVIFNNVYLHHQAVHLQSVSGMKKYVQLFYEGECETERRRFELVD